MKRLIRVFERFYLIGVRPGMSPALVRRVAFASALSTLGVVGGAIGLAMSMSVSGKMKDPYGLIVVLSYLLVLSLNGVGWNKVARIVLALLTYISPYAILLAHRDVEVFHYVVTAFVFGSLLFTVEERRYSLVCFGFGAGMVGFLSLIQGYAPPGGLEGKVDVEILNFASRISVFPVPLVFYVLYKVSADLKAKIIEEKDRQSRSVKLVVFADIAQSLGRRLKRISGNLRKGIAELNQGGGKDFQIDVERVNRIKKATEEMAYYVGTLLRYSREEQGIGSRFDVWEVVDEALRFVSESCEMLGIKVVLRLKGERRRVVDARRSSIFEAALILMIDQISAVQGDSKIEIAVLEDPKGGLRLLFKGVRSVSHRLELARLSMEGSGGEVRVSSEGAEIWLPPAPASEVEAPEPAAALVS